MKMLGGRLLQHMLNNLYVYRMFTLLLRIFSWHFCEMQTPITHTFTFILFVLCTFVKSETAHNTCLPFPGWPWNVHLYSWVTFQVTYPLTFFF